LGTLLGGFAIGLDNRVTLTNLTDEVQIMMVQENSVIGVSSLLTVQELEWYELLDKDYKEVLDGSVKYGKLIDCLIRCESQHNTQAINPRDTDGFPKFGLLQFHEDTWKEWCVIKYNFPDDIMNPTLQVLCTDKMIEDGQLWRWPTSKKCQ